MVEETGTERRSQEAVIVGITGASGVIYGIRTVEVLNQLKYRVIVIYTNEALKVAEVECDIDLLSVLSKYSNEIYGESEIEASPSSSSFITLVKGMIVIPCSIRSLAEIANGIAYNLVSRTALNFLRLRKKLVLVIRETPLGYLELYNALKANKAGAIILPASPAFYTKPRSLQDIIDFIVGKALDALEIKHNIYKRWTKIDRGPCV